jgi:DNA-binding SARP family transcriptional activator
VEFRILGPLQVLDGDRLVEIAGSKRRALLALLLLHANEVVRSDRLVDELWGGQAPRNAPAALRNHVSRLRKALGPEVLARREWGYVLRTDEESIDLHRFEDLLAAAEPLPARERSAKLAEALKLWRGPALADLANEPGLQSEIGRLEELRLTTQERRIDADLEGGRNAEIVGEIETLIAAHPLREHLRWQLILALYRAGRQVEALEVYRETRRVLSEELGLEPSPELRELERAILRQDPTIGPVPQPPPTTQPIQRSKRRGVLLALVPLALIGLGVGAAFAFVGHTHMHPSANATRAMLAGSASVASRTTTAMRTATAGVQTARHRQRQPRRSRRRRAASGTRTAKAIGNGTASTAAPARPATASHHTSKRRRHTPKRPPKPVTISDGFDGDYVDPRIWHEVKDGGDVSIVEQGGQLQLTVGADAVPGGAYNQIDVHVGTQCSFPGNFNARVDYTLLEWPAGGNISVGLNAIFADAAVMRESSSQWGDEYSSWVIPSNGSVGLPDTSGSLRIARVNGVETTYFKHKGTWRRLASSSATGAAVFGLQAMSDGHNPFGGNEIKVAFDNFKVSGIDPICRS